MVRRTADAPGELAERTLVTPIGPLRLVAGAAELHAVLWPVERVGRVPLGPTVECERGHPHAVLDRAELQLEEYFAGHRTSFDLPLGPSGTAFQHEAWAVLRAIPFGATITYGEQATRLGAVSKARAVGAANARNPLSIVVPCHRVVGSGGRLTGFAGGLDVKAWLLDHEQRVLAAS